MSMTLQGSCAKTEAAPHDGLRFVEPLHRLLHFPRACGSLIKYSYIPCKYTENTVNPQSAAWPPAQMAFHVTDKKKKEREKKSPNVPFPPNASPLAVPSFLFLSIIQSWKVMAAPPTSAYLMSPLCPHSQLAADEKSIKTRTNKTGHTAELNDAFMDFAVASPRRGREQAGDSPVPPSVHSHPCPGRLTEGTVPAFRKRGPSQYKNLHCA